MYYKKNLDLLLETVSKRKIHIIDKWRISLSFSYYYID